MAAHSRKVLQRRLRGMMNWIGSCDEEPLQRIAKIVVGDYRLRRDMRGLSEMLDERDRQSSQLSLPLSGANGPVKAAAEIAQ